MPNGGVWRVIVSTKRIYGSKHAAPAASAVGPACFSPGIASQRALASRVRPFIDGMIATLPADRRRWPTSHPGLIVSGIASPMRYRGASLIWRWRCLAHLHPAWGYPAPEAVTVLAGSAHEAHATAQAVRPPLDLLDSTRPLRWRAAQPQRYSRGRVQ